EDAGVAGALAAQQLLERIARRRQRRARAVDHAIGPHLDGDRVLIGRDRLLRRSGRRRLFTLAHRLCIAISIAVPSLCIAASIAMASLCIAASIAMASLCIAASIAVAS